MLVKTYVFDFFEPWIIDRVKINFVKKSVLRRAEAFLLLYGGNVFTNNVIGLLKYFMRTSGWNRAMVDVFLRVKWFKRLTHIEVRWKIIYRSLVYSVMVYGLQGRHRVKTWRCCWRKIFRDEGLSGQGRWHIINDCAWCCLLGCKLCWRFVWHKWWNVKCF